MFLANNHANCFKWIDITNESQNFELISKTAGNWSRFKGLHSYPANYEYSLYIGDSNGKNWFYTIGAIYNEFDGVMPGNENEIWIQYVDLWLEIDNLDKINLLPKIFKKCSCQCRVSSFYSFAYYYILILFYDQ